MTDIDRRRHGDNGSSTASTAVAEDTPLLRSETASSVTARDASPDANAPLLPADSPDATKQPLGWKRATCIVLSMWALIFLQASNMSGITTTQSTIAADLDAYESAMWFTSAYMISVSSVAPLAGRLAMIFSPATMILWSAGCFSVGALVTALAPNAVVFILGRVLLGVGSGGIMTLCMILIIELTSKKRRGLWIGLTNAGFTIGVSVGAVVFGALLPVIGWRLLFGAQAPMAALAGLGVSLSINPAMATRENSKNRSVWQKLAGVDYAGATTLTITIVLFLYGLSGTIQLLPIALSFLTLAMFLTAESFARDPIIPIPVLRSRGVLLSCLSQLGFMASRWTVLFYAPIFVLAVRGLPPAVAGAILLPTNLGFGLGSVVVGALHIRRAGSFWLPAWVSLLLFSTTLFTLASVSNAAAPPALYIAIVFLNGLCTGAALNYTLSHLLHVSSPDTHYIVTSLLSTFRGFAGSFGTAIGGGIFSRTLRDALTEGFKRLDGGGDGGLDRARQKLITVLIGSPAAVYQDGVLNAAERLVAVQGYERALEVLYKSAAAACVLVVVLQVCTGWTAPPGEREDDEGEIEEAVAEHDGTMEA